MADAEPPDDEAKADRTRRSGADVARLFRVHGATIGRIAAEARAKPDLSLFLSMTACRLQIQTQWHADRAARRPKQTKLALNAALQTYVEQRLAGTVVAPSGAPVPGPAVSWKGRRHGPRKERRWANAWSPNGPALAGHGAEAVRDAITRAIITLPEQLRLTSSFCQATKTVLRRPLESALNAVIAMMDEAALPDRAPIAERLFQGAKHEVGAGRWPASASHARSI